MANEQIIETMAKLMEPEAWLDTNQISSNSVANRELRKLSLRYARAAYGAVEPILNEAELNRNYIEKILRPSAARFQEIVAALTSARTKIAELAETLTQGEANLAEPPIVNSRRDPEPGPRPAPPAARKSPTLEIPAESDKFTSGWYDVESHSGGSWRWMGKRGVVSNPAKSRPISKIRLSILTVYGGDEPEVRAFLDGQELVCSRSAKEGEFVLTLTPPQASPAYGELLVLDSLRSGSPASDTGAADTRTLSIAVNSVTFFYGDSA